MAPPRIAFIGFGEAAQAFARGWRSEAEAEVSAYDILFEDAARGAAKRRQCADLGVVPAASALEAATRAELVISAVTADQVMAAAESVRPVARAGMLFLDINSAAPFRKTAAAARIAARGALTVDVAVMSPVHPRLHRTPLLLSGPGADQAAPVLQALGMQFEVVSESMGDASTVKMVRSIAIKGIESVVSECVTAAVHFGIAGRVIPSLDDYLAGKTFSTLADHVMERLAVHGRRRAAEMREVAATTEAAGLDSFMPAATAAHQQWFADLDPAGDFPDGVPRNAEAIAAAILRRAAAQAKENK